MAGNGQIAISDRFEGFSLARVNPAPVLRETITRKTYKQSIFDAVVSEDAFDV
jgi:hypothetical protein